MTCALTLAVAVPGTLVVRDMLSEEDLPESAVVHALRSNVLGEERRLIVHPPESYARESSRRYPVVYVLDGSSQDIHTARSAALMSRIGLMGELIVVGLPNVSGEGRQRDYTPPFMARDEEQPNGPRGEADRFLAFLRDEAMPAVDGAYRTTPERFLAGHSRGGLLVWYSLMADPGMFAARFAHSPALWRDDLAVVTRMLAFLRATPSLSTFLYLSIGSEENPTMMGGFDRARAALAEAAPSGLVWKTDIVAGATHLTNGELATPLGFAAFFRAPASSPGAVDDGAPREMTSGPSGIDGAVPGERR
jgi:predicted alpha/beta superfamily hydrolase